MSKSLKDLVHLVSSTAILKVLGIVSVMVYTRFLIKEELALVPMFAIMGRLSMVVFSFGILPTLVRDIPQLLKAKKIETVSSAINTSIIVIIPGILLFSILCYYFAGQLSLTFFQTEAYTSHLKLMSIGFFFTGVNQAFSYIYWCLSRFQQESSRNVIVGFMQVITGIAFVMIWGIQGLIISLVLCSIINTVILIHSLKDILFASPFEMYPLRKLIIESVPFYLESYLQYFRAEGDQLLVAGLLGPKALAIYYIAKKPYDILHSFTQSLDKVLTTSLAKFKDNLEVFNARVNSIITLNSFILFPVILLTIGICPTFVVLIAGESYEGAVIPSMILLLWLGAQVSWKTAIGKSIFILQSSSGRFKVTLIETVILLGLIYILGHYFSLIGVVIGRLLATVLAGICAYYFVRKDVAIKIDLRSIGAVTTYGIMMCLLLLLAQHYTTSYILLGISFTLSVSLFLFLINRTVSDKFYSVLNSISPFRIIDPFAFLLKRKAEAVKCIDS
jgi:O-antigen/teichoic acid export membrane protein